jgi:hypothetical protein
MLEKLKTIIPRLIWIMFACISGWHGTQTLRSDRSIAGVANVVVCIGLVVLAAKWPANTYYFAAVPIVLRTGMLALILFLGIAYLPFLISWQFSHGAPLKEKAPPFWGGEIGISMKENEAQACHERQLAASGVIPRHHGTLPELRDSPS